MSRKPRHKQPVSNLSDYANRIDELRKHGPVALAEEQMLDSNGAICRPYVAVDLLTRMVRSGAITDEMKFAGDEFHRIFRRAQIDSRRCADLCRETGQGRATGDQLRAEMARDAVWRTLALVGGLESAGGSCLWHVIGWEMTLKEWAEQQGWNGRAINPMQASGILVGALGAIAGQSARGGTTRRNAKIPAAATAVARAAGH